MHPFFATTLRRRLSAPGAICAAVMALSVLLVAANPPTAQAQNRGRYQLQLGDARDLLGPQRPPV
jgi:hypothetical protein